MTGAPSGGRRTLPRGARLVASGEFRRLRASGQRVARGCLLANWAVNTGGSRSRLGVVTSRRIGSAVVRNRARRLMREVFRLHQTDFREPVDLVLVARPGIKTAALSDVERDFLSLLQLAGLRPRS